MTKPKVKVFFYGSYINFDVLKQVDIKKRDFETCTLRDHELSIAPLANIIRKEQGVVYGILTRLTHPELDRLYQGHAKKVLGAEYLPEAVMAHRINGPPSPALCYISHNLAPGRADAPYVDRILKPAQQYGFPDWYLAHIASFK